MMEPRMELLSGRRAGSGAVSRFRSSFPVLGQFYCEWNRGKAIAPGATREALTNFLWMQPGSFLMSIRGASTAGSALVEATGRGNADARR